MSHQDKIFAIGEHLTGIGLSLHFLRAASKIPIKKGWQKLPNESWENMVQEYRAGYNLGCRTGEPSQFEDGTALIVFDIDLKGGSHHKETALNQLRHVLNRELDDMPFVISPRGLHYYARCPLSSIPQSMKLDESKEQCSIQIKGEMQQRPAWQLELLATGRQVVLPPSIHPETKTAYNFGEQWIQNGYTNIPLLDNATITRLCAYKKTTPRAIQADRMPHFDLEKYNLDDLNISKTTKQKIKEGVPKGERSDSVFYVCLDMVDSGLSDEIICSILTDTRYGLSEKALEERNNDRQSAAQWVYKYNVTTARHSASPPIPLRPDAIAAAEPPTECLGTLGKIIEDIAQGIQAPKAIAVQSCLAALTLLTQGIANIVNKETTNTIPVSLYFITIAESGDRKTSVDNFFLEPIRAYESELIENYRDEYSRFQSEKKATHAKEVNLLKSNNSNTVDVKEMTDQLQEVQELVKPRYPMLLVEEPTYEGLVKQLDEAYPSLGLFSSEGGRFFGGYGMSRENTIKTIAGLSSIWDGTPITRSRASEPAKRIQHRRLSLHLMVQPVVFEYAVDQGLLDGQGFLSRVLMTYPESIAGTRLYKITNLADTKKQYNDLLKPVLQTALNYNAASGEILFHTLEISETAHQIWISFYNETETALGKNGRYCDISSFASKTGEIARRLAAVLTLVEQPDAKQIETRWMDAAIQLMRYYLEERLRIVEMKLGDPDVHLAEKVLDKMLNEFRSTGCTLFCLEEIYKNMRLIRNVKTARKIFGILEEHRYVYKLPNGGKCNGKHKKEAWQLNSTLK